MQLRFAGYQALSLGQFQVAVDLLERIEIWEHREFLAAATAYVYLEDWYNAEETINSMTNVIWPHINWEDSVLLYRLLETMRQKNGLSSIPDEFVDDLKNKIEMNGESSRNLELDPALLCSPTMR